MGTVSALIVLSIVAFYLQTVFVALPLIIIPLIIMSVLVKDSLVYILAFTLGLLFDSMTLQTLGTTSLFLLAMLFLIRLYERKFETRNKTFVLMISLISVGAYLLVFGSYNFLIQFVTTVIFAFILFSLFDTFVTIKK